MKNNKVEELEDDDDDDEHDLEILKAVAQAWHGQSDKSSSTMTSEFDARRLNFKSKPSRFKLEAIAAKTKKPFSSKVENHGGRNWDFGQSLWDSYEIVAVSKRIESGLALDHHQLSDYWDDPKHRLRRRKSGKESKNSLRSLFRRMSSRRFGEAEIPREEEEGS